MSHILYNIYLLLFIINSNIRANVQLALQNIGFVTISCEDDKCLENNNGKHEKLSVKLIWAFNVNKRVQNLAAKNALNDWISNLVI